MNINNCDACINCSPNFILNCGCFLCSNCYEVIKSFIEGDNEKCYVCDKDITLSMTIDINKKNIVNQIKKYNTKESNQIIISKLKVSIYYNILTIIFKVFRNK